MCLPTTDEDMRAQENGASAPVVGWTYNSNRKTLPNLTQTKMGIWFLPQKPEAFMAYPMDNFSVGYYISTSAHRGGPDGEMHGCGVLLRQTLGLKLKEKLKFLESNFEISSRPSGELLKSSL